MDRVIVAYECKDRIIKLVKRGIRFKIKDNKEEDNNVYYLSNEQALEDFNKRLEEVL